MRTGLKARFGTSMLILAIVPLGIVARGLSLSASPEGTGRNAPLLLTGAALAPVEAQTQARSESQAGAEIFREIDDPKDGARWLLSRDLSHPGGPGVLAPAGSSANRAQRLKAGGRPGVTIPVLVVRGGDRLIVEEHSAVVEGCLEAVALGPAAVGSALRVQLTIGGKIMRARALAPGRAVLEPGTGGRP
jgi:hypothetical protein